MNAQNHTLSWHMTGNTSPETRDPGLPDGIFSKKLGKFWRALKWKRLVFLIAILNILLPFGIFLARW
jgi:hypothetical protein